MRFQVYGVRDDTGRPIKPVVIKAIDEQHARDRALRAGIRVERMDPLPDKVPAGPPEEPAPSVVVSSEPTPLPTAPGQSCRRCGSRFSFWSSFWSSTVRDYSDKSLCDVCGEIEPQTAAKDLAEAERTLQRQARFTVGPPQWRYKMVQIPTQINVQTGGETGGPAAAYLERVIQEYAALGWEFYRIDEVGVQVSPGCLGTLLGASVTNLAYYVVTLRAAAAETLSESTPRQVLQQPGGLARLPQLHNLPGQRWHL